jgi:hypothetical protein
VRRRITEEFSARQAESDSLKKIGERIFQKKGQKQWKMMLSVLLNIVLEKVR